MECGRRKLPYNETIRPYRDEVVRGISGSVEQSNCEDTKGACVDAAEQEEMMRWIDPGMDQTTRFAAVKEMV